MQQISFARTRSDIMVRKVEGDEGLESWKQARLERKSGFDDSRPLPNPLVVQRGVGGRGDGCVLMRGPDAEKTRRNNPIRRKAAAKLKAGTSILDLLMEESS